MNSYRMTILATVICLLLIAGAVVIGAEIEGIDAHSTPLITVLLTIVATAIPSLLALLKVEGVHNAVTEQNGRIAHLEASANKAQTAAEHVEQIVSESPPSPETEPPQ